MSPDKPDRFITSIQEKLEKEIDSLERDGIKQKIIEAHEKIHRRLKLIDAELKVFSKKYIWGVYGCPNTLMPPENEILKDKHLQLEKDMLLKNKKSLESSYYSKLAARKMWATVNGPLSTKGVEASDQKEKSS